MKYLVSLMVALLLAAAPASAQDDTSSLDFEEFGDVADLAPPVFVDQAQWAELATRVEAALTNASAPNSVFATLRSELADWRDTFLARQSLNAARIATVQAQITSLGEVSEEGTSDPRVSARRDALNLQLQRLQAPVILATEAHTQASGLISEIDSIIRERQAERVTQQSQSPLNPNGWGSAWDAVTAAIVSTRAEVASLLSNPSRRAVFVEFLPAILALLAVALVFVARGRVWFERFTGMIEARSHRGRGVIRFILSLGQVIVPLVGLIALSAALTMSGMMGRRLGAVIEVLALYGMYPILAHWLAGLLLPRTALEEQDHPMGLVPDASARAHRRFVTLGYFMMLYCLVRDFLAVNAFDPVPFAIVLFPFGVLMAWPLYRFGHVLRRGDDVPDDDATRSFRITLRRFLSRGLMLTASSGVAFAALGYSNAFDVITLAAGTTIYVLGLLLLLQKLSVDTYSLISRSENAAQTALIPVLIGFMLVVLSMPVLALIWGAQVTDLTELWTRFQQGFAIGATRISPTSFLLFAVVFVIGYTATRLVQGALRSTVLPRTKLDVGGQTAVVAGTGYVGIFLAAIIAITTAGIDLSGLAIVAGALSVGIGFGMQNIVSNFVSGIILLIERPISPGDWIEVGGQMGYVRDISVRSTRIETFDRTDVIVPNADLVSGTVTNYTRGNSVGRVIIKIGVAYGTDTRRVEGMLREIAQAHPMVLLNPPPGIIFAGFGASSLDFEIRVLLRDISQYWVVYTEINHQISERFAAEDIEIPFAQQDIWLRNPETLRPGDGLPIPPKDFAT